MPKIMVKGIRVWITGEEKNWDASVPKDIDKRVTDVLSVVFKDLIDLGTIDISTDELDPTEVDE